MTNWVHWFISSQTLWDSTQERRALRTAPWWTASILLQSSIVITFGRGLLLLPIADNILSGTDQQALVEAYCRIKANVGQEAISCAAQRRNQILYALL